MAELPDWQPLDQVAETALGGTTSGRVVGIVASEGAVASGWAELAALDLAERWSRSGQKVVLVDGSLQSPGLHAAAGIENGEGLSDATLFGASVGRVAKPIADGSYFVVTAGTAVADTNSVVRSGRWVELAQGFVEAGVTLGVFLRDGESGTAAFLGSASDIVVLAGQLDPPPGSVRDLEPLVRAVTGGGVTAVPDKAGSLPDARPAEGELSAAALKETAAAGRSRMFLLLLFVLVLVAVLAAVFGLLPMPGASPQAADSAAAAGLVSGMGQGTG